jgi:hypothetical protein
LTEDATTGFPSSFPEHLLHLFGVLPGRHGQRAAAHPPQHVLAQRRADLNRLEPRLLAQQGNGGGRQRLGDVLAAWGIERSRPALASAGLGSPVGS